jgi:hypothetical protein
MVSCSFESRGFINISENTTVLLYSTSPILYYVLQNSKKLKFTTDKMKDFNPLGAYVYVLSHHLAFVENTFFMEQEPYSRSDRLIVKVLRSHTLDTPHSVRLLWTSDQFVVETSTWQHTTLTRDRPPCPRRDSNHNSSKRAVALDRVATGIGQTLKGSWRLKLPESMVKLICKTYFHVFLQILELLQPPSCRNPQV